MELEPGRHKFGDVEIGDTVSTPGAIISGALIDSFADVTGDRFEIHMDDAAAREHGFERRVAHGLLVLSVVDGLKNQTPAQFAAIASLGWDWAFRSPVLSGDTIRAKITVGEKRQVSKAGRGILRLDFVVTNQSGQVVQKGHNLLMVYA